MFATLLPVLGSGSVGCALRLYSLEGLESRAFCISEKGKHSPTGLAVGMENGCTGAAVRQRIQLSMPPRSHVMCFEIGYSKRECKRLKEFQ